eukprot:TRINITY_DN33675_c0_g1_i1.p3 TRINITY_DN33675_c0_g1~~TRINITY_DN33675_c0_g1_i1.p3  ORF type:complete len:129 (-),score=0.28 TRINITY_DN33675_c0_g1_i1:962-1348(-)
MLKVHHHILNPLQILRQNCAYQQNKQSSFKSLHLEKKIIELSTPNLSKAFKPKKSKYYIFNLLYLQIIGLFDQSIQATKTQPPQHARNFGEYKVYFIQVYEYKLTKIQLHIIIFWEQMQQQQLAQLLN